MLAQRPRSGLALQVHGDWATVQRKARAKWNGGRGTAVTETAAGRHSTGAAGVMLDFQTMTKPWEIESKWYAETARRIAEHAERQRITLYQLSARSGVAYLSTARYIREGRRMPAFALARYAQVLGVSVADLVGEAKEAGHRR